VALAVIASGCATGGDQPATSGKLGLVETAPEPREIADPNEAANRAVFEGNQKFYNGVVYPLAKAYTDTVPAGARQSVDAAVSNLSEPLTFANNVLQLRPEAAASTLTRFAINSTVGIGGLFDVATKNNIPRQTGDLGQTFYVWGVRDSQYLVLPIVGPTTVRDAVGSGLEMVIQAPAGFVVSQKVATFASGVSTVGGPIQGLGRAEELKSLEESSLDFYVALRSVATQKRQAELDQALSTSLLSIPLRTAVSETSSGRWSTVVSAPAWNITSADR
jgi:phospholipid-binding lipoprotein MlaA